MTNVNERPDTTSANSIADNDVIGVINYVQNIIAASDLSLGIDLPEIVVLGGQSTGKSSTLESLVGEEFLPSGQGTVTRRPIVIQLIPDSETYGEFLHKPGQKFNFKQIKKEIVLATNEECSQIEYSSKPIMLSIHSPTVVKLTVVDLPGIFFVPDKNKEQSPETVQEVQQMVRDYISKDNVIILAVTAANIDIQNSVALEMVQDVDPKGLRTIGVLTMVDQMAETTDARDILQNVKHPLKKGWVGVINRSPKDILEQRDMEYILEKERTFFENETYRDLENCKGIPYLQQLLHKTLKEHIRENSTSICEAIAERLLQLKKDQKEIEKVLIGPAEKRSFMYCLLYNFIQDIRSSLLGSSDLLLSESFTAGSCMKYTLDTEVKDNICSLVLVPDSMEIARQIMNNQGISCSISSQRSSVVKSQCRKLISKYQVALKKSVSRIKIIMEEAIDESATLIDAYPSLKHVITDLLKEWTNEEAEITYDKLENHIDSEMNCPNFDHPQFEWASCKPLAPSAGPMSPWIDSKNTEEICTSSEDLTSEEESASHTPKSLATNDESASAHESSASFHNTTRKSTRIAPIRKGTEKKGIEIQMEGILECNEKMRAEVKYITAIVLNHLKIVKITILDLTSKYISNFLVKKMADRIAMHLTQTIMESANMASLMQEVENDLRQAEDLRTTIAKLEEAALAIQNL